MYQRLIGLLPLGGGEQARRLKAIRHSEHPQRLPDPLVDGMFRYVQFTRDLLAVQVLRDKAEAILLLSAQARNLVQTEPPYLTHIRISFTRAADNGRNERNCGVTSGRHDTPVATIVNLRLRTCV
jgi:hypothetical protein